MSALPAKYAYLNTLVGQPRILQEALALYGVHETPGVKDNPIILAWAKEVGLDGVYRNDATPWCGLFMALVVKRAGYFPVTSPLWALNWSRFGIPAERASIGDVLTFHRDGGGHVGLYVGEDDKAYHVLGGNTADSVSIARLGRERLATARRCLWRIGQPAGVAPHKLAADGEVSHNEA